MDRRRFLGRAATAAGLLSVRPRGLWASGKAEGPIRFEEIAAKSGLHFATENSPTPNKNQIETMPGGIGLFDYDRDGYLDIYLVGGAAIPSLRKESPSYWNRLFHNNHDGTSQTQPRTPR
jgi:hypothetical protein